ncbi:hypothetical protein LOD99_7867 [Oopsacas minuta]|uniref:Uncharacterized protein n=1 Tax=Oopsacas minuta TaxID=111878 RepID=A0AAV7JR37_9METZ|nr:hypothetical protein LOD99_7867 [Oopsacas minuta]
MTSSTNFFKSFILFSLTRWTKIGNYYWLQCLYCNSDAMMSKLNLVNRHFFGVGPSSRSRLKAFSAEHKTLFHELKECYINGNLQLPKGISKLAHGLLEGDLVTSSIHTDSEESQFYSEALPGAYIRKLLVHFGVSIGISTRFVENFWFNKLARKILPFLQMFHHPLEQTTLPQLSTEARDSLLFANAKCPYITCECDGWTTMARNSLFCLFINGHKLDSEEKISLLYDQTEFEQQMHGAPEIYAFLKSAILN